MARALVVGISAYGHFPRLRGPCEEARRWRSLLMEEFAFDEEEVLLLADEAATRPAIVESLRWLLAATRTPLVFVFCGHGTLLRGRDGSGRWKADTEEALIAHPLAGERLGEAAIFSSEIEALVAAAHLSRPNQLTIVLDCCFAATESRLREPLIVAGAGDCETGFDVPIDGEPRLLFSRFAIDALRARPSMSYSDLIDEITPRMTSILPQHPALTGDLSRAALPFLG